MAKLPLRNVVHALRALADARARVADSDGQLLERFARRRDEAAFAALLRRHGPLVHGVCRRALAHAQDAEDAFQATILILVKKGGSIRKRRSVGGRSTGSRLSSFPPPRHAVRVRNQSDLVERPPLGEGL